MKYDALRHFADSWGVLAMAILFLCLVVWELRKRLNLEDWILEQLTRLYDCQEEEIPELEIDVDELLDMESDDTRAARVKELLVDCYKPTEAFISGLLDKIRGMQKLSTPQKK